MNVTILRMANAERSIGYREWRIAGHRFAVEPGHMTLWNVRGAKWTEPDLKRGAKGVIIRGARLDWHRKLVKLAVVKAWKYWQRKR